MHAIAKARDWRPAKSGKGYVLEFFYSNEQQIRYERFIQSDHEDPG